MRPEQIAGLLLHLGGQMGEGAHGAGKFADADDLPGLEQAFPVALHFCIPEGEFEAEGGGFGVDAVGAADADGVFELIGPCLDNGHDLVQVGEQDVGGLPQAQGHGGVQDVRRGQGVVQVAAVFTDVFGDVGEEGDDVVLGLGLDLFDAGHVKAGLGPDMVHGCFGDEIKESHGFQGREFDFEPGVKFIFFGPDTGHLGPAVAWNH